MYLLTHTHTHTHTNTAFFGMNLPTGLEAHPQAFYYIVAGSLGLGAALFATAMAWTRGAGKVRMRKDLTNVVCVCVCVCVCEY